MGWYQGGDKLDQDIFDAMVEFYALLHKHGEQLAERFKVPVFCVKAMRRLEGTVSMKELGRRMACDPSFVTMIADALEDRGLARREPSAADRRIKNLVLTPEGLEVKAAIEQAMLTQMPWARALDVTERQSLLTLIRKMTDALAVMPSGQGEVSGSTTVASPVAS